MNWIEKKQIGEELLNNMDLSKEQYYATVRLLEELDAEFVYGYKLPDDAEVELDNNE